MNTPPIVSPQEWEAARQELLVKEKEVTRARDALAAERRRMPWMAVEKEYAFEGPDGQVSLLDLFEGRRQLIVYRVFFEPGVHGWPDAGCLGCSMVADQVAHPAHLNARDTTLAYVSRAPRPISSAEGAHGLGHIPWYTITDDFDKDFGVDEWHGTNAFIRDGDRVFRTYFIDAAATRRWGPRGATSTSPRSDARRNGRTRRRATPRRAVSVVELHDAYGAVTRTLRRPVEESRPARRSGAMSEGAAPSDARHRAHHDAPAQRVFDAWTSEEVMRRWWHAGRDWETPEASVDLRVGGEVRIADARSAQRGRGRRWRALHGDRPAAAARVHLAVGRR